ncbi:MULTISPECIES: hypothetical protein [Agrobacterium]|uniref:hypothetical protein n=1 Tax=Agrobacterium TaxID=357 RepID=UPI000A84F6A9|nr:MULTISPECIES: hypothetical protein [Agrobacterium]
MTATTITPKRPAVQACLKSNARFHLRRNVRWIDARIAASSAWGVATLRRPLSKTE